MKQLSRKFHCYKVLLFFSLLFSSNSTIAQVNLIPDPSFEDTVNISSLINGEFTIQQNLKQWRNLDSTRIHIGFGGYFNYNSINGLALPNNFYFYQHPKSGFGFVSLTNYWVTSFTVSFHRSFTRTKLLQKLIAGKKYCAKAYLAPFEYQDWYTNGFGMYFDNGQLDTITATDSNGIYDFVNPQIQAQYIIKDTLNWSLVSGTFVANGSENFITMGNFLSDSATQKDSTWIGVLTNANVCNCGEIAIDQISLIPVDIANWLRDTMVAVGDSVYIGLPTYEVPDALWYNMQGVQIGQGSGIKVKAQQGATKYIQSIDVCDKIAFDTLTVYAFPLGSSELQNASPTVILYPNPATNVLNISFQESVPITEHIKIYNAVGALVMQPKSTNQNPQQINIAQLSQGLYFVKVRHKMFKFLKE